MSIVPSAAVEYFKPSVNTTRISKSIPAVEVYLNSLKTVHVMVKFYLNFPSSVSSVHIVWESKVTASEGEGDIPVCKGDNQMKSIYIYCYISSVGVVIVQQENVVSKQ